jgi:pimeloyl-ACP methyl ester carboxylesterase
VNRSSCHEDGDVEHSLEREDGGKTFAVSVGSGARAVILMPMSSYDHCDWLPFARMLATRGVQAWAVDSSGSGGGSSYAGGSDPVLVDDVLSTAAEARAEGATSVVLAGASMGGTTVLGAAKQAGAERVASLSAPSYYGGVDALAAAKRLDVPVLLVVGDQDDATFVESAHKLAKVLPKDTTEYVGVVSGGHGTELLGESVGGKPLIDKLAAFLTTP